VSVDYASGMRRAFVLPVLVPDDELRTYSRCVDALLGNPQPPGAG
jgi:hypothetical protein